MNLVDVAIIVILGLASAHGVTQGAALQVLSFGGFWIGLLLGAWLAPLTSKIVDSDVAGVFISLITFLGMALVGGAVGRYVGTHAWGALRRLKLGAFDQALGAVVAVVAALGAVWLIAIMLSAGPTQTVSQQMNRSKIVRLLVERLPPAPAVFSRLQQFISVTPFPRVFEGLEPIPSEPIDVPGNAVVQAAVNRAQRSTVMIRGIGCGGIQTGSGFVAAEGLVVTNAHVVAGIANPEVRDANGTHLSEPVLFDSKLDVAVLRTTGLAGPVLPLAKSEVSRGTGGAVLGYPGGGPFDAKSAAVLRKFAAVGRDIYGRDLTRRDVYQLQSQIKQGNSGGPFVTEGGTVLGVVFAASTTDGNVGYALTSLEVSPRLAQAQSANRVGTGPCTH
ncbi:MAG: MarP family serine protease [Actinomycetota bacterium]